MTKMISLVVLASLLLTTPVMAQDVQAPAAPESAAVQAPTPEQTAAALVKMAQDCGAIADKGARNLCLGVLKDARAAAAQTVVYQNGTNTIKATPSGAEHFENLVDMLSDRDVKIHQAKRPVLAGYGYGYPVVAVTPCVNIVHVPGHNAGYTEPCNPPRFKRRGY
jgi:hypothetical protein